jgi:multiple sugar transport system substrate-binding protein
VRAAYAGCHSFAIPRTSRQRDAAGALLRHLTRVQAQLGEARRGAIPCRAAALDRIRAEVADDVVDLQRWRLLADMEPAMIIPPRFAAYPQCEDALWRSVQRAMLGEWTAAEAVHRASADVHAIVTSYAAAGEGR